LPIYQKATANSRAVASLAEEVRELHKLAMDRRTASLALFRNSAKRSAIANNDAPALRGKRASRPDP
jgi:hypothetical protein